MTATTCPQLVNIEGDWTKGDGRREIPRIISKLFSDPAHLTRQYWGLKNYDRFHHQAFGPCRYFMGPRHGHVVARIEAAPALRKFIERGERPPTYALVVAANQIRDAAGGGR